MSETKTEGKMRANSLYLYRVMNGMHEWDFPGIGKIVVDPAKASMEARHFLLAYGIKQWVNDGGAVEAGPDGKVNPRDKFDGIRERAELLNSGATELRRKAGGSGVVSWVTRALVALGTFQGRDVSTPEKANEFVQAVANSPKFNLGGQVGKARTWLERNSRIIGDKIAELKAAEAPEDVDADEILADL